MGVLRTEKVVLSLAVACALATAGCLGAVPGMGETPTPTDTLLPIQTGPQFDESYGLPPCENIEETDETTFVLGQFRDGRLVFENFEGGNRVVHVYVTGTDGGVLLAETEEFVQEGERATFEIDFEREAVDRISVVAITKYEYHSKDENPDWDRLRGMMQHGCIPEYRHPRTVTPTRTPIGG